jgi:hypothetical protein
MMFSPVRVCRDLAGAATWAAPAPQAYARFEDREPQCTLLVFVDHPLPQGLAGERKAVLGGELLGGQCRPEISVVLAHDP